jgi:Aminopeptidase N
MRNILIFIFALTGFGAFAQAPDPNFTDKISVAEREQFLKKAKFVEAEDYSLYDLTYQRLSFDVNPAVNFISGSVFSSVKFLKDGADVIHFDLNDVLVVDSVLFNEQPITISHLNNKVSIGLPQPTSKGEIASVQIFYHGAPPQNGMGSFVASQHAGTPIVWTLSEPYGAKDWWPCKESLQDKIDSLDIFITSPKQYLGASNGKLIENKIVANNNIAHWKHKYPIATYLVGIAVTNYQTYSDFLALDNNQKIEVLNYVYPEYLATAKSQSANILSILANYNKMFITYPFASEKYGHAQFGWGGGMEHQTMSFMTSLDFELVAHEMAHQWFGDYITLASWHDIWLNEGFATYLTGLTYEKLLNGQYWSSWKNSQINRITSTTDGSVYVADTTNINRIFNSRLSYSKGAYLLHMLRWEMGDAKFFSGLTNYLNDQSLAYNFASQEKFVKHMESAADTSFTEFFKDWYYGEGFPTYRIVPFVDNEKQKVRISQTPSSSSVSFFKMHIPLRIWKDGKYKDIRLYNTAQNQEFIVADFQADKIEFDPDKWLIAKADMVNGTNDIVESKNIRIIPEYQSNSVEILLPDNSTDGSYRLIDLTGKVLMQDKLTETNTKIALSELSAGIYIIEVNSGTKKETAKIFAYKNRTK